MDHGGMDMGGGSSCVIEMLWNWNTIDACFLSSSWQIKNGGMMAASCIGVALLVVLLEFCRRVGKEYDQLIVRQFQRQVAARTAATAAGKTNSSSSGMGAGGGDGPGTGPQVLTFRASPLQQLIRAVLHAVTFGLAYIVMLLVMYFNGYIIISVIIGAGIGKFVCDWLVCKVVVDGSSSSLGGSAGGIEEPSVCCG